MAKTIQEQYNQIKKGKGSKELFLKEVKRNYPHMIVNSATFDQAEEILLNRSVLSENIAGVVNMTTKKPDWFKIFDDFRKCSNSSFRPNISGNHSSSNIG